MLWELLATGISRSQICYMWNISSLSTANANKRIASASKAQTVDTIDLPSSSRYAELLLSSALLPDVSCYYVNKTRAEALSLSREKRYSQHPRVERFEMPPCILISIELFLAKLVFAMQMRRSPRYGDLKATALQSFPDPRPPWLSFSFLVVKSQRRQRSLDDADTSIATIKRPVMLAKDNFIAREDALARYP